MPCDRRFQPNISLTRKAMTNYEAIRIAMRIMDKDELAEFLSSIMDGKKCPTSEKFCDGQRDCVDAILIWLNAESDDDTVVEHLEGQTINISHANVVFFD